MFCLTENRVFVFVGSAYPSIHSRSSSAAGQGRSPSTVCATVALRTATELKTVRPGRGYESLFRSNAYSNRRHLTRRLRKPSSSQNTAGVPKRKCRLRPPDNAYWTGGSCVSPSDHCTTRTIAARQSFPLRMESATKSAWLSRVCSIKSATCNRPTRSDSSFRK